MGFYNDNFTNNTGVHTFDIEAISFIVSPIEFIDSDSYCVRIRSEQLILLSNQEQEDILPFERVPGGRRK